MSSQVLGESDLSSQDLSELDRKDQDSQTIRTPRELTRTLNPPERTRLAILLSFPLLFLLAIPFWYFSTSIERLPLPTTRIEHLESIPLPTTRTKILLTADAGTLPNDHSSSLETIGKGVQDGVDELYKQYSQPSRDWDLVYHDNPLSPLPLHIHLRLIKDFLSPCNSSNVSESNLRPYIQREESGLTSSGIPSGTLVIPIDTCQIDRISLIEEITTALVDTIPALYPPTPAEIPLRALKYSPNITLSFVLLNEDSSEGSYVRSWDIKSAIDEHFIPHLKPLNDIFKFNIESQLLYHAPLSFEPQFGDIPLSRRIEGDDVEQSAIEAAKFDGEIEEIAKEVIQQTHEKQAFLIDEEEMKVFINSEQWSLDSASTNNPVLRFLLYVPAARHRPLRFAVPDSAQSFLVPQFGGVALLNPPLTSSSSSALAKAESYHLPKEALKPSFNLFTKHLYALLALPTLLPSLSPTESISPWQIHQTLLSRSRENSDEARKTLKGISRLVKKIKEMKVGSGVRGKVTKSVQSLEKISSEENLDAKQIFLLTRDAVILSNEAFFDPSMMGLLYFPDEHKFAVYTPLFAPIALPLLMGLLREFLAWKKRRSKGTIVQEGQDSIVAESAIDDQSKE